MEKELEKKIKKIEKTIKKGDTLEFMCDGKKIGNYKFVEWSADAKAPLDWLHGCFFFSAVNGLDIEKVVVKFNGKVI